MPETIQITIPVPGTKGVQQESGHWSKRSKARKTDKGTAYFLTKQAMGLRTKGFTHAELHVAIFYRDNAARDTLNTLAALKATVDGMVDAGAVLDDRWQFMPLARPEVGIDKANPRVVLTLTEIP
jgi:hypothetical protein